MKAAKLLSLRTIALKGLQPARGTMKVTAALAELLAADTMVNLCSAVGHWYSEGYTESDRQKINEVDDRVLKLVNDAWLVFEQTDDPAASTQFVPVLLSAAASLRELVCGVDFYDDTVIDPWAGVP